MRLQLLKYFIATGLFVLITSILTMGQDYKVTFTLDMSKAEVADPATVGIRGSEAPLSWTKTYPMKGPDKNGMYTVSISFENMAYGTRVQYKYYHDDNKWDNDRYGEKGNRIATLCCKKQKLPTDTWDELDEFSFESKLLSSSWDNFITTIFLLGKAKKHGQTMEEIAQENIDFWDWPMWDDQVLRNFLIMDEFNQAKAPDGFFELVEHTPEKLEYVINKDWEIMFYQWSEKGEIQGVTAKDMTAFIKYMYNYYVTRQDYKVSLKDEKDHKMRITITK